jgi:hypothetical protein
MIIIIIITIIYKYEYTKNLVAFHSMSMQAFKSHFVRNQNDIANNENSAVLLKRLHKGHYYSSPLVCYA